MGMNMGKMLKQAQKMQAEMARLQEEMAERTITGSAGGGAVQAVVNGKQELLSVTIKPEVVDPEDLEMLQDLVTAAVNDALKQSQEMVAREMGRLTGGMGLNLPGGLF